MSVMTTQEQDLHRVAYLIYEARDSTSAWSDDELREHNRRVGWSFEIRYQPTADRYVSETSYTRVAGLKLSDEDFRKALDLADLLKASLELPAPPS